MSLLLDALKKAAEKNAHKDAAAKNNDATKVDLTEIEDRTDVADRAVNESELEQPENITQFELAEIIKAQKIKDTLVDDERVAAEEESPATDNENLATIALSADDERTDIRVEKLSVSDLNLDSDPSLLHYEEDEDPSLKLALSDEEILLTDDDVTEFLGGDELQSRLDNSKFSIDDDETELKLIDRTTTQSLNLVDPPQDFTENTDSSIDLELTSTTLQSGGQTSHLNSLTNDATLTLQDSTSTHTFASDNYDRTLVKLEEDVSKVFTGMKAGKSGAAMTPDFAKKVFVQKSTSLRRQNYKLYGVISIVVLMAISIFTLFEMQTQIDDIDTGLVRLKQNPVPSALRFQRKEKNIEEDSILQGRIDTKALNLLKSLTSQSNDNEQKEALAKEQTVDKDQTKNSLPNGATTVKKEETNVQGNEQAEIVIAGDVAVTDPKVSKNKPALAVKKVVKKAIQKATIKIKTKTVISKESIWLKEAYSAFEKGNLDLAAMNYERVLAKNARNRDALLGQAAIFALQNKNTQAINNYQAVLLENPRDILAMTSLIAASTMSPVESESRLKLLQRESPKATYLQFALGNVVSAQNRWQEAQQYYFSAYQAEPKNPDYAYNLAVSLEQINKPNVAITYYEQALKYAQAAHSTFNVDIIKQRIEVLSQ